MRIRVVPLIALIAALACGQRAAAQRLSGKPWFAAAADGVRYAVDDSQSAPPAGAGWVRDDVRGTRRSLNPGCHAYMPSIGWAMTTCDGQTGVVNLGTRRITPLRGLRPNDNVGPAGANWVEGLRQLDDGTYKLLGINWRTGEQSEWPYELNLGPLNLDASWFPTEKQLAADSLLLGKPDGRYAIQSQEGGTIDLLFRRRELTVTRCRKTDPGCQGVTYGAGIVSWDNAGLSACAYVARTRRTGCFKPPGAPLMECACHGSAEMMVSHTAKALYVTVRPGSWDEDAPPPALVGYRVNLAPLLR